MSNKQPTQEFKDFQYEEYQFILPDELKEKVKKMPTKVQKIFFYYANMDKQSLRKLADEVGVSFNTISKYSTQFEFQSLIEEYRLAMFEARVNEYKNSAAQSVRDSLERIEDKEKDTDLKKIKIYDIYQYSRILELKLALMKELKSLYGFENEINKNIIEGNMEHSVSPDDLYAYLKGVKNEEHKDTV